MISVVSIQNSFGTGLSLDRLALLSGYLGAVLGVCMVVPQIVRTLRNRSAPGVSALSWSLTALSCGSWLLYGVRTGEIPQIPGNLLMVSGAVLIVLAVPSATTVASRGVRLGAAALAAVALAMVLPPVVFGSLAFGVGVVAALPQTIKIITRDPEDKSAVSLFAWFLRAASQVCWLCYAVVRHDLTVTLSAACILASALVLITAEWQHRRTRAATTAGAGPAPAQLTHSA